MTKKVLAFVLAVTMVLSFTCLAESADTALEPITLTVQGNVGSSTYMVNGVMEDPVAQYIRENTGVSIDLRMLPDSGDSSDKLNAQIAANDLPDIFCLNGGDEQFLNLLKGELIYPLDDLVEQYAPNLNADPNALAMMAINRMDSPDGKLYKIGLNKGYWDSTGMGPQRGYYVRWDLMKELGYPETTTIDQLVDTLTAMQALEPETAGGLPTYAAAAWNTGVPDSVIWPEGIMEGYECGPYCMLAVDIDTKQVLETSPLKDPNSFLWNSVRMCNKLNQNGVFDPDSFTQTYQNYMDKSDAGTYMMVVLTWSVGGANTAFINAGTPEKQLICLPSSDFGYKNVTLYDNMIAGERQWCIAKTCKYPERAVQMLDFMSTFDFARIAHDGPMGMNWDMVDGKATITNPDFIGMSSETAIDNALTTGARIFRLFSGYASATVAPDGQAVDLLSDNVVLTDTHKDFLAHYGKETMRDVYTEGMNTYVSSLMVNWGTLDEELVTYAANLDDYLNQCYVNCIMAPDDDAFEAEVAKSIEGLAAYRFDEIFDCYYNNAQASSADAQAIYDLLK